ncbi:hypothetical protein KM043_009584 [Ampulex compressa]|nr:hypothetical protein KM043_009584 [Ampulex compressa]
MENKDSPEELVDATHAQGILAPERGLELLELADTNSGEAPDARNDVLPTPSGALPRVIFLPPTGARPSIRVPPGASNTCSSPTDLPDEPSRPKALNVVPDAVTQASVDLALFSGRRC